MGANVSSDLPPSNNSGTDSLGLDAASSVASSRPLTPSSLQLRETASTLNQLAIPLLTDNQAETSSARSNSLSGSKGENEKTDANAAPLAITTVAHQSIAAADPSLHEEYLKRKDEFLKRINKAPEYVMDMIKQTDSLISDASYTAAVAASGATQSSRSIPHVSQATVSQTGCGCDALSSGLATVATIVGSYEKLKIAWQSSKLGNEIKTDNSRLHSLEEEIRVTSDPGKLEQLTKEISHLKGEIADKQFKREGLKQQIGNGLSAFILQGFSNACYFVGSIAENFPATGWVAAGFGSIGYGALLAASKFKALYDDYQRFKSIDQEINVCNDEIYKIDQELMEINAADKKDIQDSKEASEMRSARKSELKDIKELYQARKNSLEGTIFKDAKLKCIKNWIDLFVGLAAIAAGIVTLAGAVFAPYFTIPLLICLGASLCMKLKIYFFQRSLIKAANLEKTSEALADAIVKVEMQTHHPKLHLGMKTKGNRGHHLPSIIANYVHALADRKGSIQSVPISQSEVQEIVNKKFKNNVLSIQTLRFRIAEEWGILDIDGKPDPMRVKAEDLMNWTKGRLKGD